MTVATKNGEATARDDTPKRETLYHIFWQTAELDVASKGPFAGRMQGVRGELYEKDRVASTFTGDYAKADRDTGLLTLTGHVTLTSRTHNMTLVCDRVEWHSKEKIVKAFGNIKIRGSHGEFNGLDEVWATSDMNYFSTPDMFKKP